MPFLGLLNPKQSSRGDGLNWIFMVSRAAGAGGGGGDKANGNTMLVENACLSGNTEQSMSACCSSVGYRGILAFR